MRIFAVALLVFSILMSVHGAIAQVQPAQPDPYEDQNAFRSAGPITDAERNAPWPSRDQSAETYRDAFCKVWDDGCTKCERDEESRVVNCKSINTTDQCNRKEIVCSDLLLTQARVCLMLSDNCNETSNASGASSAVLCHPIENKPFTHYTDYTCTAPRHRLPEAFNADLSGHAKAALAGHWQLTDTSGNACIVSFNDIAGSWISTPCSDALTKRFSQYLNGFDRWPHPDRACRYSVTAETLKVFCEKPHPQTLVFSIKNPEFPIGIGSIKGWRLTRISTLY